MSLSVLEEVVCILVYFKGLYNNYTLRCFISHCVHAFPSCIVQTRLCSSRTLCIWVRWFRGCALRQRLNTIDVIWLLMMYSLVEHSTGSWWVAHMHVRVCACTYNYISVHAHNYTHICTHACACMYTRIYNYVHVHTFLSSCMHTQLYIYACTVIHACMCVCVHACISWILYIMHAHTHTHTEWYMAGPELGISWMEWTVEVVALLYEWCLQTAVSLYARRGQRVRDLHNKRCSWQECEVQPSDWRIYLEGIHVMYVWLGVTTKSLVNDQFWWLFLIVRNCTKELSKLTQIMHSVALE